MLKPLPSTSSHQKTTQQQNPSAFTSPGSIPLPQKSNLEANQIFWNAVNHHLALSEQAHHKSPSVDHHLAVACPTGQREATSKQADPLPSSFHGCTPSVRQNASKKLTPTNKHRQASSTSYHNSSIPSPSPQPPYPIIPAATSHSSADPHPVSAVTIAVGTPSVCHNAELPNSANNVNLVEDQQIESIKEHPNSAAKPIKLKQLDVDQSPLLNQQQQDALERFKKKVRAQTQSQGQQLIGSSSANPFEALIEDQSDEEDDDYTAASFNSDTDDGPVEPIDMGYQSADGRSSHNHAKSSASVMKTNKRHPNIPLNVRLRARKNSYSSSHKYLCM